MLCDSLTPISMDTNYMNEYISNNSRDSNINVLQFLRTCKSDNYLKLMFFLVEKDFYMYDLMESIK